MQQNEQIAAEKDTREIWINRYEKEQKAHILKSFEGKVAEMTKHKVANAVIENCYNEVATAPQRNRFVVAI